MKPVIKLTLSVKSDTSWYSALNLAETTIDIPVAGNGIGDLSDIVGEEATRATAALLNQPTVARAIVEALSAPAPEPADPTF